MKVRNKNMGFSAALVLITLIICISFLIGYYMDYCKGKSDKETDERIEKLEKEIERLKRQ